MEGIERLNYHSIRHTFLDFGLKLIRIGVTDEPYQVHGTSGGRGEVSVGTPLLSSCSGGRLQAWNRHVDRVVVHQVAAVVTDVRCTGTEPSWKFTFNGEIPFLGGLCFVVRFPRQHLEPAAFRNRQSTRGNEVISERPCIWGLIGIVTAADRENQLRSIRVVVVSIALEAIAERRIPARVLVVLHQWHHPVVNSIGTTDNRLIVQTVCRADARSEFVLLHIPKRRRRPGFSGRLKSKPSLGIRIHNGLLEAVTGERPFPGVHNRRSTGGIQVEIGGLVALI